MLTINMEELVQRTKNLDKLTGPEVIDVFCELGALIGILGSRDSILMTITGTAQYADELKLLMESQALIFPMVVLAAIEAAKKTETWKRNAGNFSSN